MGEITDFPTTSPAYCALERIAREFGDFVDACDGSNERIALSVASTIEGAIKAGTEALNQLKQKQNKGRFPDGKGCR